MFFEILKKTPIGRRGRIHTSHGTIETPCFIFCGTHGSIKSMPTYNIKNTQIILCNAFHLRNVNDVIKNAGGLHKFMGWNGPIITDSGGFQVMTMGHGSVSNEIKGIRVRKSYIQSIKEAGCTFRNPVNGDLEFFDAERSIDVQCDLGVDLAVCFDECTVSHKGYNDIKKSMELSHRWCLRSLNRFKERKQSHQHLYGLVHGGTYKDLREQSVQFNLQNDFDAYAIGGTLGRTNEEMYDIVSYTANLLQSAEKPIHLLGIGRRTDLYTLSQCGIDTFDCVEPTRIARHGTALTVENDRLNLNNACYKYDYSIMDTKCSCTACSLGYTKSYLHYLLKIKEKAAFEMITEHNMWIMNDMMAKIRRKIEDY